MRKVILATAALLLLLGGGALVLAGPHGEGPDWKDSGADGHSALVSLLSEQGHVAVIESSLALLPPDAGEDDLLLLFPGPRELDGKETDAVRHFVMRGGNLVVAADGDNAAPLFAALGVQMQGLPALLASDADQDCVVVEISLDFRVEEVCLPSPTIFANVTTIPGHAPNVQHFLSTVPVFLDTDLDGNLSLGDQGPVRAAMALEWHVGRGRVLAIADGDLWRQQYLEANRGLAEALAQGLTGTIFVDSTGSQKDTASRLFNPGYRALAHRTSVGIGVSGSILAVVVFAAASSQRIRAFSPHDPPQDAVDASVAAEAEAIIRRCLDEADAIDRPPRPPRDRAHQVQRRRP